MIYGFEHVISCVVCGRFFGETGARRVWDGVSGIHGHIRNTGCCWVRGGGAKGM